MSSEIQIEAPTESSASGHEYVRYCRACGVAVKVRWTWDGDPVFWTCEECGIRERRETDTMPPERFQQTAPVDRATGDRHE